MPSSVLVLFGRVVGGSEVRGGCLYVPSLMDTQEVETLRGCQAQPAACYDAATSCVLEGNPGGSELGVRCDSGAQRAPSALLEQWFRAPGPLAMPRTGGWGVSRGLRPRQPLQVAELTVRTGAPDSDVVSQPRMSGVSMCGQS